MLKTSKQSLELPISFLKINLTSRVDLNVTFIVWDLHGIFFDSWIGGSLVLGLIGALQIGLDRIESGAFVLTEVY